MELNAKLQNDALLDYYDRRDDKFMKIEKRKSLASLLGGGGIGSKKNGLAATNDFNSGVDRMYAKGRCVKERLMSTVGLNQGPRSCQ